MYRVRDRILVNPKSPASAGDDVLLSSAIDLDTQHEVLVIPGHLQKVSDTSWSLKQYANGDERSHTKVQFPSAWKVVSHFMRG